MSARESAPGPSHAVLHGQQHAPTHAVSPHMRFSVHTQVWKHHIRGDRHREATHTLLHTFARCGGAHGPHLHVLEARRCDRSDVLELGELVTVVWELTLPIVIERALRLDLHMAHMHVDAVTLLPCIDGSAPHRALESRHPAACVLAPQHQQRGCLLLVVTQVPRHRCFHTNATKQAAGKSNSIQIQSNLIQSNLSRSN
eukprot:354449-Chlamydomonas_euryale.AAC.3